MKANKTKRARKIVAIVLAVVLVLLVGALAFAGNYLFNYALNPNMKGGMFYNDGEMAPLTGNNAWLADHCEDRWLTSRDGLSLHGLYVPNEAGGNRYAVICHGYGSLPQYMGNSAHWFYDQGFNLLLPAARTHERSEGTYASMGWLERLDIVDWANTLAVQDPDAQIVLYGVSMGGATVMMASGEDLPDNVKCVVEDCGYSSVWDEFAGQLKELFGLPTFPLLNTASGICKLRAGFSFGEASAVNQLKKTDLPILFIHGEDDSFVPYWMLDVVYEACASPDKERLSVPGAAHARSATVAPELYWGTIQQFLEKYIDF